MRNEPASLLPAVLRSVQRGSLLVGGAGLVLCIVGVVLSPALFFRAYLFGYLFWFGVAAGCLALALLHELAGGAWGAAIGNLLDAAASTLPLMALLFVPLVFGLPDLYEWARAEAVAGDALLQHKSPYLNVPFFLVRSAIYFLALAILAHFLHGWSREREQSPSPRITRRLRHLGAGGLVVSGLTASFAAIDWMMSLEPHWSSTIYAAMVVVGEMLTALAFVVVIVALVRLTDRDPLAAATSPALLNDLGSLLLAFVILWAYLAFSQFLLIFAANLPEEITWYVRRLQGGWQWLILLVIVFVFVVPLFVLVQRHLKRRARALLLIAAIVFLFRLVDLYWLVAPALHPEGFTIGWLDVVAPIGVGGVWLTAFLWRLGQRPLLRRHDPATPVLAELRHEHG